MKDISPELIVKNMLAQDGGMPKDMTERKKELIEELSNLKCNVTGYFTLGMRWQGEQIADLIIARERRIVDEIEKPLKDVKDSREEIAYHALLFAHNKIDEALSIISRLRGNI